MPFYEKALNLSEETKARICLREAIAQYDASHLAWREKTNHDLARPKTLIYRLRANVYVRAYKISEQRAGFVEDFEWEPLIPIQPHAEYPYV